jgi:hypothetical protein
MDASVERRIPVESRGGISGVTSLSHAGRAVTDRWEWGHPSVTWACYDKSIAICFIWSVSRDYGRVFDSAMKKNRHSKGFGRKSAHFIGFPSENSTAYGDGEATDVIRHINIYGNMTW